MFVFDISFLVPVAIFVLCTESSERPTIQKRNVGGEPYAKGNYPFLVSLWFKGQNNFTRHFCSGALVDSSWVLTAAHCFDDNKVTGTSNHSLWEVYVGIYKQSDAQDEAQKRQINQIVKHPHYNGITLEEDIALIELTEPVNTVTVATYNTNSSCPYVNISGGINDSAESDPLTIIGWGQTSGGDHPSHDSPHEATVNGTRINFCQHFYNAQMQAHLSINDKKICNVFVRSYTGNLCNGDTGSPVLAACGGKQVVVGIASSGLSCSCPSIPFLSIRVSTYDKWIDGVTQRNVREHFWLGDIVDTM